MESLSHADWKFVYMGIYFFKKYLNYLKIDNPVVLIRIKMLHGFVMLPLKSLETIEALDFCPPF